MKLSVILVSCDMEREIPRSLQSLARDYQQGARELQYEVLLIDNGSPVPLNEMVWAQSDVPVRLIPVPNASPSPAKAINIALAQAKGEVVCLMMDGAHLLTPGVFRMALASYQAFDNPVVAIRYFYLGVEEQPVSVTKGYDKSAEDKLLERIHWPEDGYRLFEISTPLRAGAKRLTWFNAMFESNCLFLRRSLFVELGGAEERFDSLGGGFLNLDTFKRAVESFGVTPIQIIGEGSFQQLHGAAATDINGERRAALLEEYREEYARIRGHNELMTKVPFVYMGHMPTVASNITAVERRRARLAGKLANQ
jgi:glycosyltransferase involved in cell wall biosynthesis